MSTIKRYLAILLLLAGAKGACQTEIIPPSGCAGDPIVTVSVFYLNSNICAGDSTAAFYITVSGVTTYTTSWSNGAFGDTLTGLHAGSYQYSISSPSLSCNVVDTVLVSDPTPLSVVLINQDNVSCTGDNDGEIEVGFAGNTDTVSYSWSNASINYIVPSLFAGTYTVSITDTSGCVAVDSFEITQPSSLPFIDSASITNAYCLGGEVGSMAVFAAGGTGPYTYLWNSGHTNNFPQNMGAGTYVVSITDAQGCISDTSLTLGEPSVAATPLLDVVDLSCFGAADGSMAATPIGGTSPFYYYWSNSETTSQINNLEAGFYNVTIYDVMGCTWLAEDSVNQPTEVIASLVINQNILCHGDTTASALVSATGGNAPYSFSWSQGSTLNSATGLGAGSYSCVVTDDSGCVDTASFSITQPTAIALTNLTLLSPSCFGDQDGSITLYGQGGTGNLQYLWSTGDSTASAENLAAGTYNLTITDSNSCVFDTALQLTQPGALEASITEIQSALCSNTATGTLSANAIGGTPGFTYVWSTGDTTGMISQLFPGIYSLTLSDANGCEDYAQASVTFTHLAPISGLQPTTVVCDTTEGTISAAEGYASYQWSNGDSSHSATVSANGLLYITISSAEGCQSVDSTKVFFASSTPFTLGADTLLCTNEGDSTLFLDLETSYASYVWNTADTTSGIIVTTSGTYSVTATNVDGCPYTDSINVRIEKCPPLHTVTVENSIKLNVYPNPSEGNFTLGWSEATVDWIDYTVYAANGTVVKKLGSSLSTVGLNLSDLPSGLYYLKAVRGASTYHLRLLKQ